MKENFYLLSIAFLFLFQSCSHKTVHGTILLEDRNYDHKVYLIDPVTFLGIATSYVGKVVDSAVIDDRGQFIFSRLSLTANDYLYFIALQKKGQSYKNFLQNESPTEINYFPIILNKSSRLEINIQNSKLPTSIKYVKADQTNEDLLKLNIKRQELYDKLKRSGMQDSHDENTLLAKEEELHNYQIDLMNEAYKYNHSLIELQALRWASIEGIYERIPELIKDYSKKWKGQVAVPSWERQINELVTKLPLSIGDDFPDYGLPMADGKMASVKKQLGSSLTLIDMWASWCAPCRQENKTTLVPLWDRYNKDGFQIIGYALDSDKETWKKAILKDGADRWHHGSHLKGDESPFFELLKISTIPANYLLDADGRIIAKNLHGEKLVEFVNLYLARK